MKVKLNKIIVSPRPVRMAWAEDEMQELEQSIREDGLVVPVKLRPNGKGYEIVYGHRRVEAKRRIGDTEIEAIVDDTPDDRLRSEGLIENQLRESMTAADRAVTIRRLIEYDGWSSAKIGGVMGWTKSPGRKGKEYVALDEELRLARAVIEDDIKAEQFGLSLSLTPDESDMRDKAREKAEAKAESDGRASRDAKEARDKAREEAKRAKADAKSRSEEEEDSFRLTKYHYGVVPSDDRKNKWGLPEEMRVRILNKALRHGASVRATRDLARAVKVYLNHGDNKRASAILRLNTNINPDRHNPEFAEAVHQTITTKSAAVDWEKYPSVREFLDWLVDRRDEVDAFKGTIRTGKLAPEAARFAEAKLGAFIGSLEAIDKKLKKAGGQKGDKA